MRFSPCIAAIFAVALISSCVGWNDKQREIPATLLGREIVIPDSLECRIQDTPIDYDRDNADFKIITYIDSASCTTCRMKLPLWNSFINELKKLDDVYVPYANGDFRDPELGHQIVVMDLEGNYIKSIDDGVRVSSLAYNPTTRRMYVSTWGEPQFGCFEIND